MADPILESSLKTRLNTMCCDIFYCKIKKFRNFSCASKQLQVCFPLTIFQSIDLYRTSFEIFDSQIGHELHKIGRRDRKISIGKIGQTAWQNRSDMTKIGSATVRVNGGSCCTKSKIKTKTFPWHSLLLSLNIDTHGSHLLIYFLPQLTSKFFNVQLISLP